MPFSVRRLLELFHELRPFTQDVVIAAVCFVLGGMLYASGVYPLTDGVDQPLWTRFAVLLAVCLLQLLRRRWALLALALSLIPLAADIALGLSAPVLLAVSDHIYAAVLYGSRRASRLVMKICAAGALLTAVGALVIAPDWRTAILVMAAVAPFVILPVWWASTVRTHRELAATERANSRQLARIAELDRKAAVAAERAGMARDLHDVIAGHLSAIAIQSEAALSMAGQADEKMVHTVLESVRSNSVDALSEMRAMIGLLRADGETDATTAPARLGELSKLTESARAAGMNVVVRNDIGEDVALPAAVDLTAYRIAQESLTNAMKHAPGTTVTVEVRMDDGELVLEVTNQLADERAPHSELGHGLHNMRERAQAVGGSFKAGPAGPAWRVFAMLPLGGQAL